MCLGHVIDFAATFQKPDILLGMCCLFALIAKSAASFLLRKSEIVFGFLCLFSIIFWISVCKKWRATVIWSDLTCHFCLALSSATKGPSCWETQELSVLRKTTTTASCSLSMMLRCLVALNWSSYIQLKENHCPNCEGCGRLVYGWWCQFSFLQLIIM